MHPLVELAKQAIEAYITEKKIIKAPEILTSEMKQKAGVFVSLKKHGELRGCIGTFSPTCGNAAEEIIRNAIEAAASDPRFSPVKKEELNDLVISVDVLSEPLPSPSIKELDAKRFGIIVKSGHRRGLLLPDLEGVETPEDQIEICRRKGGIGASEPVEIFKFEVRRYK
ncbi:MAG: AMMECR1 domain-containing protein [Candidatus Saganbacteria bacterium]|uniref:AMMECR1 domain-containing protein n=1 Tax=Candidatus Saganbacteria bacterium TaxID=2575572 RepID=A0A833NXA7_UNCSA|nr:MAG: AMMECR1 domain-containing protein [Candidatus Saganbacteria bacterium]